MFRACRAPGGRGAHWYVLWAGPGDAESRLGKEITRPRKRETWSMFLLQPADPSVPPRACPASCRSARSRSNHGPVENSESALQADAPVIEAEIDIDRLAEELEAVAEGEEEGEEAAGAAQQRPGGGEGGTQ